MVVSGRARYTYSNKHPLGSASAKRSERTPWSSITIISPGSISRTNEAPMMSRAAVSLANTQPRSSRPRESGRIPCGSRAPYKASSSMNTSENAPLTCGSSSIAAAITLKSGCDASKAVNTSVSLDVTIGLSSGNSPDSRDRANSRRRSAAILVMFPLWPSARCPVAVARNVGCAFSQILAPVVE